MANQLFNLFGNNFGNMANLVQRFQKFKQTYQGNPQQQIQQMLNSGQITQDDYNRAVQQAKELQKMLGL